MLESKLHQNTEVYQLQINAPTERLNRTKADIPTVHADVEHVTRETLLPHPTFPYNMALKEATGFAPDRIVHGGESMTTLAAMLPHHPRYENDDGVAATNSERVEEAGQLT